MKILDNKTDIDICIEQFRLLITEVEHINHLVSALDEIMFDFSTYVMLSNDFCGGDKATATKLYRLKSLRDVFIKQAES